MNRLEKQKLIEDLNTIFNENSSVTVVQYKGLTVAQLEDLREKVYSSDIGFKVIKNNLASIAAKDTPCANLDEFFVGPTAIVYGNDPVSSSKILSSFSKKHEALSLIGGSFTGSKLSLNDLKVLSTLPSFDEIRAKIVGLIIAAPTKIAIVARTPATNVIGVLQAYASK